MYHQPTPEYGRKRRIYQCREVLFKSYLQFLKDPGFGWMVVNKKSGSNSAASLRGSSARSRRAPRKHAGAHPSRRPRPRMGTCSAHKHSCMESAVTPPSVHPPPPPPPPPPSPRTDFQTRPPDDARSPAERCVKLPRVNFQQSRKKQLGKSLKGGSSREECSGAGLKVL